MKKKILIYTIILCLILFQLTGCYDATSIEDFYYIVAIGIDESETEEIKLIIQTAHDTSKQNSGSSQSSEYKIYSVDCNTIDSGINILNNYLSKTINLSNCSAIIFSESVAKKGIKKYINILENNTEMQPSCHIIVSSTNSYDILTNVSNSGEHFSSRLYDYILTSVKFSGYTINSDFTKFFSDINNQNSQALAIYAITDSENETVQNFGAAVFKDDIMVGTISPIQTIMHQILLNELDLCTIEINNPFIENNKIDINIKELAPTYIDVSILNNTPYINSDLFLECIIDSSNQTFDYTNFTNISILENAIKQYIEDNMYEYLYLITKEYDSDVIGLYEKLNSKYFTTNELEKIHWNKVFSDSFFKINTNIKITSSHLFNKE